MDKRDSFGDRTRPQRSRADPSRRYGPDEVNMTPTVDICAERLRRAGWSVGDVGTASGWLVTGTRGEATIQAPDPTLLETWRRVRDQAAAAGTIARAAP
jgi:hypothetical protein